MFNLQSRRKEHYQRKPTAIWLLSQVRRAGQDEQKKVLEWLRSKFAEQPEKERWFCEVHNPENIKNWR
jgi:hypothetical protein